MVMLPPEESAEALAAGGENPFRAVWAAAWVMRGRLLVAHDTPEAVIEGLRCFDQAIVRLGAAVPVAREGAKAELAVVWMNRGSVLLRLGEPGALKEAVHSYEQAVALIDAETAEFKNQNALGAAWMNRGVGLLRLGGAEGLAEALRSLERAVAVLEPLVGAQPGARRNLAAAWANRGLVLALQGETAGAVGAHREAVNAFRPLAEAEGDAAQVEFAALLLNLGQAGGVAADAEGALTAMREALALVAARETADLRAADMALRARHAVCVILGGLLASERAESATRSARLAEAGDLAEDGLAVVRGWGAAGAPLAGAGGRLYEFGAWLYRTQQPQFLAEFLLEHLGDDPARAEIAGAAVQRARQAVVQRGFADDGAGGLERAAALLDGLGEVEARLRAIASAAGGGKPA